MNCQSDANGLGSMHLSDLFQKYINNQKNNDPCRRFVYLPVTVHLYSVVQFRILDKHDDITGLDATGSIVCLPNGLSCKRILYYAINVRKFSRLIPMAEMITSEQNSPSIESLLKNYKNFLQSQTSKWPVFKIIAVDWSWVLINGLLCEWNKMNMLRYLDIAYQFVTLHILWEFFFR